jgi:acetyltransferase-like isoleucine patch superfamily enzyme
MLNLIGFFFRIWVDLSAWVYGGEGINIPLMFMPTRFIAPTLRRYGAQIGERVRFQSPLTIHNSQVTGTAYYKNLFVGSDCYFGRGLFLDLQDRIIIEEHVTLSHQIMIMTHTDAGTSPLKDSVIKTSQGAVIIHRGAYLGARATVLQGVEVGEGAIVGAGALVNKSIPSHTVALGVPAKTMELSVPDESFERKTY